MRDWKALLKKLGFTEGESGVYIAALELGAATVQDIAKKARVSRVTTYAAIERLVLQGLVTTVTKGKRTLYHAEPPKRLIEVVSRHVAAIESTLEDIKDSVDELSLLQGGEKPAVKVYEGPDALNALQDDFLAEMPKQLDVVTNMVAVRSLYAPEKREAFLKKEGPKKVNPTIRVVGVLPDDGGVWTGPVELKIALDHAKYDFAADISVYKNKVALSVLRGKQFMVLIESKDLSDAMRALFDQISKK
ncbi:MAG: hypothetical protein A2848_01425 [Candidatus Magasanikbacteria bacterium RIFCSPHIGHO2_01_FULL_50_8]|uniref:Transcription regulator TrmB N-terminal domain-containing protein n=2 Tax=Candidatus Magasanikiibacteriota TaxID=1752731 RepID=A0A1F6LRX1_9BACT|nr:MAG: hypothetical protein A2848_01425 [Candidatus Magasanikbacteria bacterium RIFCSPHIGHO2_01_FULL_50_8]OGH67844.1 MAG: hypothetical protein A3C15_02180 [Candidatus Magasanikbacteria bacterium RIFCSPHIGHO2_02_FULL_50_9b]